MYWSGLCLLFEAQRGGENKMSTRRKNQQLKAEQRTKEFLDKQVKELVEYIRTYESDTFSASGNKLTLADAQSIAGLLIKDIEKTIDGVQLTMLHEEYTA
jgi:hypothetical protein